MNSSRKDELHIQSIGTLAMDMLSTRQIAAIFGVTSRGIFVKFANNRMIFLSFENYRGPLTANLSEGAEHLSSVSTEETVTISQGEITFSKTGIQITTANSEIWKPSINTETPLPPIDRINLIRKIALDVQQLDRVLGRSEMLPILAGLPLDYENRDNRFQKMLTHIDKIRNQIALGDFLSLYQTTGMFLGLGSGLTPSGDDFVLGLTLSLNRWYSVFQPSNHLSIYNQKVVEDAYKSTTMLSANLIESAASGLADERLIWAVDFLATGKYPYSKILSGLLSWGNSSGMDAFVGMITAFSSI